MQPHLGVFDFFRQILGQRKRFDFKPRGLKYIPAEAPNIDQRLYAPVQARYWTQKELKDGTYNYIDLLDILEVMAVDMENRCRDADAAREEAKN